MPAALSGGAETLQAYVGGNLGSDVRSGLEQQLLPLGFPAAPGLTNLTFVVRFDPA